jgi:uncharacterized protein YndB with AHSA1/START domain
VSRTIQRSVDEVWDFITSPAGIAVWLGEGVGVVPERGADYETDTGVRGETRGLRDLERIRLTWQPPDWSHDTTLQLALRPAGPARTTLVVHQERLVDAVERERQRRHWQGVITAIADALTDTV